MSDVRKEPGNAKAIAVPQSGSRSAGIFFSDPEPGYFPSSESKSGTDSSPESALEPRIFWVKDLGQEPPEPGHASLSRSWSCGQLTRSPG